MTTETRPTAEQIVPLWPKHEIDVCVGTLFGPYGDDTAPPERACALGVLAFDLWGTDALHAHFFGARDGAYGLLATRFGAVWTAGVQYGFDGAAPRERITSPEFWQGYATGQAVRRAVVGEDAP